LEIIGIIAALISSASWALGSILFSRIGQKVSPFGMTLTKGIFGIGLLAILYVLKGFEPVPFNAAGMLFISGIIGISVGDTLFFASLQYLGPKVQIIFFMMGQVLTAILGILILKELPFGIQWIGIFLTLIGVAVVLWNKLFSESSNRKTNLRGVILGILAMLCFSFAMIIAKQAMITISALSAVLIRMIAGTIGIFIYGLFTKQIGSWLNPVQNRKMLIFFFLSVFVVTFGGFWLGLVALKNLNVVIASTLGATEPLFVLPLALFILKERITFFDILGAFFTTFGIIIIVLGGAYF
jgi:drug/metabolite transporter (DMT)-like permease